MEDKQLQTLIRLLESIDKDLDQFLFAPNHYDAAEYFEDVSLAAADALALAVSMSEFHQCFDSTADEIVKLREANEAFAKRQAWWTERMFELEKQLGDAVLAEREACAAICDEGSSFDGDIIRARGRTWE